MGRESLPEQLWCLGCGRMVNVKDFDVNHNENHKDNANRHFYCKDCCRKISDRIFEKYTSYELCCREMCSLFDLPYVDKAMIKMRDYELNTVKTEKRNVNRVFHYGKCLAELEIPKEWWSNLSSNNFLKMDLLKVAQGHNEDDDELFLSLEQTWGNQDRLEDYLFLEEHFYNYTNGEKLQPSMVNTIRYMCQAELDVVKLKEKKSEQSEIAKAEKRVMDYYKVLKLDDFKFSKQKSEQSLLIEEWAWRQENVEPLDWVDENYDDICHFRDDNDEIMRCLGNKILGDKKYPQLAQEDVKPKKKGKKT